MTGEHASEGDHAVVDLAGEFDASLCVCGSATEAFSEHGRDVLACKASGAVLAQWSKSFD